MEQYAKVERGDWFGNSYNLYYKILGIKKEIDDNKKVEYELDENYVKEAPVGALIINYID